MKVALKEPANMLNEAYAKQVVGKNKFDYFNIELINLVDSINENESEEHNKNIISEFLNQIFYNKYTINTHNNIDLVVFRENITSQCTEFC